MDVRYDHPDPWHGLSTPPGGRGGVKASRSDLSCHFALYTPILHKKDPQGKADFVVVFLDMYHHHPWGQGRGPKLLEVTFLATLPYIHPLYIKGPSGQARLCGGVPGHV